MDDALAWIESQRDAMTDLLVRWSAINSYSFHLAGLAHMFEALELALSDLGRVERIDLPLAEVIDSRGQIERQALGQALRLVINSEAPRRVLLNIHYDTVYPPESDFRVATREGEMLRGPGVLDAKGGIVVLVTAVRAFLRSEPASQLGIEILLTPDEEVGSPGSGALIVEAAKRNRAALVYEPAMPDGAIVDSRKGSGNFTFIVRGRAAHAGRDFASGRSAILAAAELVVRLSEAFGDHPGITANCGRIEGGDALNVVPDLAIARFNFRVTTPTEQSVIETNIQAIVRDISTKDGISVSVAGGFHSPPKMLDVRSQKLLDLILESGRSVGLNLQHRMSGGASDGNRIAAAGVPVIDSLGPVGADLHSDREHVRIASLVERAKLSLVVLGKLATGQVL